MPVAIHITPSHMSREDYERCIGELEARDAHEPDGRLFHAAYGEDHVHMFELWQSREDFEAHRDRMFEALQCAGVDGGIVEMHPVHSDHPD